VVATINTNGTVRRYLYEPYGQQIRTWIDAAAGTSLFDGSELAALGQPEGADYNPWRYASGYYDKTTGMLKFGTRYYIPQLARWTQVDPKSGQPNNPVTLNPYGYVGGNPVNETDPTGRDFWDDVGDFFDDIDPEDVILAGAVVAGTAAIALAGAGAVMSLSAFYAGEVATVSIGAFNWGVLGGQAVGVFTMLGGAIWASFD
jgi:RHS repeat-associated protein